MIDKVELNLKKPCGQSVFLRLDQIAYVIPDGTAYESENGEEAMEVGLVSGKVFSAYMKDATSSCRHPLLKLFETGLLLSEEVQAKIDRRLNSKRLEAREREQETKGKIDGCGLG